MSIKFITVNSISNNTITLPTSISVLRPGLSVFNNRIGSYTTLDSIIDLSTLVLADTTNYIVGDILKVFVTELSQIEQVKYLEIETVIGLTVTLGSKVKFLKSGMTITNMKSNTTTNITKVMSDVSFTIASATGFTNGSTAQVIVSGFDGEYLSKYLPNWLVNDDMIDFLSVFATEIKSQRDSIRALVNNSDPELCPTNLLPTLASSYGIPMDSDDSDDIQRQFIKVSQHTYRQKGSYASMRSAFRSLGYNLEIREYFTGKYVQHVIDRTGDVITLSGTEFPPSGSFLVDDMIAISTGAGDRVAAKNPGKWCLIAGVNSPTEYSVYNEVGGTITTGDEIVIFAYTDTGRQATTNDFNDIVTNPFPVMSSFIKGIISDIRPDPIDLTPEVLSKLLGYIERFKSSHARLRGAGLEKNTILVGDFSGAGATVPYVKPTAAFPAATIGALLVTLEYGTYSSYLDSGEILDSVSLDEESFMSASIEIVFQTDSTSTSDTVTVSESYSITSI